MNKKNGNILIYLTLIIVFLSIVAGGSYYLRTKKIDLVAMYNPAVTSTSNPTANWQTYTNKKYMYSIKYPNGLIVNEQNSNHYVAFEESPYSSYLHTKFLVSVIPDTFLVWEPATNNYMSSDWIKNLYTLKIGETKALDRVSKITRLADTAVNGRSALVIEFTAWYKQHRVYIKANGNFYMISNYYLVPQTTDSLATFQLFLSTFKFIQ